MIAKAVTCADCIEAVLKHLGLPFRILERHEDRVFADGIEPGIMLEYCRAYKWTRELQSTAAMHHPGAVWCRREKDVSPALQITYLEDGRYDIDLDYYAPQHLSWRLFAHWGEVLLNKIKRRKTDPVKLARLLKKRGIAVPVYT